VYLYATLLLQLAEQQGVRVLTAAALLAWNEKLGFACVSVSLMAPLAGESANVDGLAGFAPNTRRWVLIPLVGGQARGWLRCARQQRTVLRALRSWSPSQQTRGGLVQAFLPGVDRRRTKRILLVNGEPLGAIKPPAPARRSSASNLARGRRARSHHAHHRWTGDLRRAGPRPSADGPCFSLALKWIGERLSESTSPSPPDNRRDRTARGCARGRLHHGAFC